MALSRLFKEDRRVRGSSLHTSLLQTIDAVMSLAFCPPAVSQAHRHLRSFETPATRDGCSARQSVSSVISLDSGVPAAVYSQGFSKVDVEH